MRLALLEDDDEWGQAAVARLVAAGHHVEWPRPSSGCEAHFAATAAAPPELLLLDLRPPNHAGLGLLRRLRARGVSCPAIVLTARDQVGDRIHWQQAGADDCLVDPFALDALLARIDAFGQRRAAALPPALQGGERWIDFGARLARRGNDPIALTAMEWALLVWLARHPRHICSRAELDHALGGGFGREQRASNAVEVIVSRLRRKLGAGLITTHRGQGYRLQR